jgi:hypothetical protein
MRNRQAEITSGAMLPSTDATAIATRDRSLGHLQTSGPTSRNARVAPRIIQNPSYTRSSGIEAICADHPDQANALALREPRTLAPVFGGSPKLSQA